MSGDADPIALVSAARAGQKRAIGKLISIFEDTRPAAAGQRKELLALLAGASHDPAGGRPRAHVIGMTGTPGAGKSTLIGALALELIRRRADARVAVLAVDPSSHVSGGALLGDRTRVRFPAGEERLFFRSQASDRQLGGVSRYTFAACRLLCHLFDYVFIETVGIGQSEIEIHYVADHSYLVLQPMAGDEVQFMKAGIMEIPDAFILNKCDQVEAAERSLHALRASLRLARLEGPGALPPIFAVSARTGAGMDELLGSIIAGAEAGAGGARGSWADKERHFFEVWVRDEFGRTGLALLASRGGGGRAYLAGAGCYDAAQVAFARDMVGWMAEGAGLPGRRAGGDGQGRSQ